MLLIGVNQKLGEQRREQSLQDCVTPLSGHLAGERDQLCEHHGGGDLLVPWGKPGPLCFVQGLASSPENRLVGGGMGVLDGCCFSTVPMKFSGHLACGSNHSCLLCDSRCCLRCRKTAGKWKKEAHPSDTEA